MDYELSDEVENRLDEIKKNGNSIFYVDMAVMATEELEDPLSKIYGENHCNELYQDIEDFAAESEASTDEVYDWCEEKIQDDGYILGVDVTHGIEKKKIEK
mgnify:CR=1 FL=1